MSRKVTIWPVTDREKRIVDIHGPSDWLVLHEQKEVICFHNQPGCLVIKNEHMRWIRKSQVREQE